MSNYINREKLENKLRKKWEFLRSIKKPLGEYAKGFWEALAIIENFPSTDVAPVVHGKWIYKIRSDSYIIKCSVCGIELDRFINGVMLPKHCFCGARMDGENNG